jgi:hypothetical protein
VQLSIVLILALVFDIVLNCLFVAVLTYSTRIVTIRPELSAPQLLFNFRTGLEYLFSGNTFDGLNDLLDAVHWDGLDEKMDVVLISANFEKSYVVAVADF